MALQQTYVSGVETDLLTGVTFTKELLMTGKTPLSAYVGSYQETSLNRPIWTCDAPTQLVAVYERHSVLGSTSVMLVKAVGSTPLGSSALVLSANIALTAAVDVTQSGTILNSTTLNQFAVGDQVGALWSIPGALPPTGVLTLVLARL